MEDWRFAKSPYVESGGLRAYAGAPLRLQHESGETVCLGSLCVASSKPQDPLTRTQQTTLVRLADWIVHDIVQVTRARRQRERRRMAELIAAVQEETNSAVSEEPVIQALQTVYPDAVVNLHTSRGGNIAIEGRSSIALSELSEGLWEDTSYIDEFIAQSNHLHPPTERVVRLIAAPCESVSGQSLLTVGTKSFRMVFDDVDAWFLHTCAGIVSQMWHRRLLREVMVAKEKFLRGFSHQLRTPVHGILGSVELLGEELNSWSLSGTELQSLALLQSTSRMRSGREPKVFLDMIKRSGRDLISIINSMITLNRWADVASTERHYASHTMYDLERDLANEMQNTIMGDARYSPSIFFNHDMPPGNYSIHTDLNLLRDSVLPLIENAIQNTATGFVIITFSVRPESDELVIDVKDTGRGIPISDQQRIFELYEQLDVYSTGAGLGMTLASRFAALLRGSVELVSSEVDQGSHFRAAFQDVAVTYRVPALPIGSWASQLRNIPKHFHVIQSSSRNALLSDHFAKFLTCHGFTSSDQIKDALLVVDFAIDSDHHGAISPLVSSKQIIICLMPTSQTVSRLDGIPKNVVYVYGPFLTSTMTLALQQADELLALFKANQDTPAKPTEDLSVLPQPNPPIRETHSPCEESICNTAEVSTEVVSNGIMAQTVDVNGGDDNSLACTTTNDQISSTKPGTAGRATDFHQSPGTFSPAHIETTRLAPPSPKEDSENIEPENSVPRTSDIVPEGLSNCQSIAFSQSLMFSSRPTCLLVDDNAINLRLLRMYCSKRKLPHICAKNGLEAVSLFQRHQESSALDQTMPPIQLILMDLQMPVCDGIEATKRIRRLEQENGWRQSVLFVVTGQDTAADRKAAASAGGHEYYVKPVSIKSWDAGVKQYFPRFEVAGAT